MDSEEKAHILRLKAIAQYYAEHPKDAELMTRLGYPVTEKRLLGEWESVKYEDRELGGKK
jgi:hypothetical protein